MLNWSNLIFFGFCCKKVLIKDESPDSQLNYWLGISKAQQIINVKGKQKLLLDFFIVLSSYGKISTFKKYISLSSFQLFFFQNIAATLFLLSSAIQLTVAVYHEVILAEKWLLNYSFGSIIILSLIKLGKVIFLFTFKDNFLFYFYIRFWFTLG